MEGLHLVEGAENDDKDSGDRVSRVLMTGERTHIMMA